MTYALQLQDLGVRVGGVPLVSDVSFALADGERVALLGCSGSGKSLTAAAVCGTLPPTLRLTGSVRRPLTAAGLPDVALVQQDSALALHPLVTVGAQLSRPLRARGLSRAAARAGAHELLGLIGMTDPERVLSGYPAELSGGQRQRVCIALAIACRARVLVADEPTTALDVVNQALVLEALEAVPAALLLITHDLAVAARLCSRVLVMHEGRVVEDAPMSQLLARPGHQVSRELVARARRQTAVAR